MKNWLVIVLISSFVCGNELASVSSLTFSSFKGYQQNIQKVLNKLFSLENLKTFPVMSFTINFLGPPALEAIIGRGSSYPSIPPEFILIS